MLGVQWESTARPTTQHDLGVAAQFSGHMRQCMPSLRDLRRVLRAPHLHNLSKRLGAARKLPHARNHLRLWRLGAIIEAV
eukprot:1106419-Amphidinium_carterae.1